MPAKRSTARRTTRTKRPLRPRTPSRIKKRTRKTRSHHHPELWGLGMVAVGLFLVAVVDLGWSGGVVGAKVADGLHRVGGGSAYVIPLVLLGVGGLMLVRSSLVDLRPFQTGLAVGVVGLLVTLGSSHGGFLGDLLGGRLADVAGQTGALIVGLALLIAGTLLVTGASTGALLRRSGHAFALAGAAARRSIESFERPTREPRQRREHIALPVADPPARPPLVLVDGACAYPDVVTASAEPPALVLHDELEADTDEGVAAIDSPSTDRREYRLPDRAILKASPPVPKGQTDTSAHTADLLVQTLAHFGVDATIVGQIAGPRVVRYELQL
ncbi:MAG: DNA translocase FtsK 4TM domain-containing protein, partial [Gaiellaceae bacterium]